MIIDYFSFAVSAIKTRRLRSWLTILGIFIGIAAVVSLISIGQGMQVAVTKQFEMLGSDLLIIMPGGGGMMAGFGMMSADKLSEHDLKLIQNVRGIEHADEILFNTAKVTYQDETEYPFLLAIPTGSESEWIMERLEVDGRWLKEGDRYKAVVGYNIVNENFFEDNVNLGEKIYIEDQPFTVVGSIQRIGNRQDDTQIYIPIDTAREILDEPDDIDMIYAKVQDGYNASSVALRVSEEMRDDRDLKVGEENFSVQTSEQLMQSIASILGIIQTLLVGIAAISLLVGGVGIMNTMYTSVLERTREIGVMKAIGARNYDIMAIFLVESGLLGLVGGLIGCVLGIGLARVVELYGAAAGFGLLQASITPELILFAAGFSFGLGCLSGLLPARAAAKLKPVEALRYE